MKNVARLWTVATSTMAPPVGIELNLPLFDVPLKDPEGWRLLIGMALETAMRAGELLGMRWDEVKLKERFVVMPTYDRASLRPSWTPGRLS